MVQSTHDILEMVRSKIVATVGPACRDRLEELVRAGVDVFRLNMAHGSIAEHESTIAKLRLIEETSGRPVGILVDLSGPKIRLGALGKDPLSCRAGDRLRLVRSEEPAAPDELTCSCEQIHSDVQIDDRLLFADGVVRMKVISKSLESVELEVETDGELRANQGINLPGVTLQTPALTEVDRVNAEWAVRNGADFLSLSFVRSVDDVRELRGFVQELVSSANVPTDLAPDIIAKIEKREALDSLEAIVSESDAVMVARGDLGVELDVAEMPVVQKRILTICSKLGRPAIVATQMLDSMQMQPRPTRAEATDVANAILDGADACMLSGETAIGAYPLETVRVMNRILHHTERLMADAISSEKAQWEMSEIQRTTAAIVSGCKTVAEEVDASLIVVVTHSGATARALSSQRQPIPILGASHRREIARKMCLYWGVEPFCPSGSKSDRDLHDQLIEWARCQGLISAGQRIVFAMGKHVAGQAHNAIVVHEVPSIESSREDSPKG